MTEYNLEEMMKAKQNIEDIEANIMRLCNDLEEETLKAGRCMTPGAGREVALNLIRNIEAIKANINITKNTMETIITAQTLINRADNVFGG